MAALLACAICAIIINKLSIQKLNVDRQLFLPAVTAWAACAAWAALPIVEAACWACLSIQNCQQQFNKN